MLGSLIEVHDLERHGVVIERSGVRHELNGQRALALIGVRHGHAAGIERVFQVDEHVALGRVADPDQVGNIIGAVVQVQGPTYDKGKIIVGVYSDGIISGMEFLELSDSPGFGLKANDPGFILPSGKTFYGQFAGKNASEGFSGGRNFDSISGATITSHAAGELVNYGAECILKYFSIGDAVNE